MTAWPFKTLHFSNSYTYAFIRIPQGPNFDPNMHNIPLNKN